MEGVADPSIHTYLLSLLANLIQKASLMMPSTSSETLGQRAAGKSSVYMHMWDCSDSIPSVTYLPVVICSMPRATSITSPHEVGSSHLVFESSPVHFQHPSLRVMVAVPFRYSRWPAHVSLSEFDYIREGRWAWWVYRQTLPLVRQGVAGLYSFSGACWVLL